MKLSNWMARNILVSFETVFRFIVIMNSITSYFYAVVSSRQQSPEAAAQAAERLQKLQLEQQGKGENVTKPGALVANGQANFVSPKSGSTLKQARTSSNKKTSSNAKKKPKPGNNNIYNL